MSKRILVIDDHDHMRYILKLTLEMHDFVVTEAENGQAALEAIKAAAEPHDLIFCDVDMPIMHGIDFVRHFRAEYGPATPLVMLSAESSDTLESALAAGATSTVSKPFEPTELLRIIEKILK